MNKEMIKAIRLVKGINPDLRVKANVNKWDLFSFIDENRFGIFGVDFGLSRPDSVLSDSWPAYEHKIWNAVLSVIEGRPIE